MKGNFETLTAFAAEIERQEDSKNDYVVPGDKLAMVDDKNLAIVGEDGFYGINDYAHGQLAGRLGFPKKFYDELPGRVPGLRSRVVNELLGADGKAHMVRTLDGNARAIMSDRYMPIDNLPVLKESIFPVIQDYKDDLKVKSFSLSPTKMYLQLVFPNMKAEIEKGDMVYYGLTLTNSEVGAGALDIKEFLWWLLCANGAIGQSFIRKYHVGRKIDTENEETYRIFGNDTLMSDLNTFKLKLRDTIKFALSDVQFAKQIDKIKELRGFKIDDVTATVQNVTRRFPALQAAGVKLIEGVYREKQINRYGLVNAVTALCHDIENPDAQYEIEKTGHQIIELSDSEWKAIAA